MSDDNKKGLNTSEAIILNSEKLSPSLNDILSSENSKEKEIFPKINRKIPEDQPLSMNILKKKSNENQSPSLVIQIPQSIGSEDISTLDESVSITISRDFNLIYTKLKYVINPFISKEKKYNQILQWDLWGPLLLNLFLKNIIKFFNGIYGDLFY